MKSAITRRAGPLLGAWLVLAGLLATVSPAIPVASALDPTPEPQPTATPVDPAAQPFFDPGATPAPAASEQPGATPVPDPSAAPDPSALPDPSASPVVGPEPTPGPSTDPTPDPSSTPLPEPSATPEPAKGVRIEHVWIDSETDLGALAASGPEDEPLAGMTFSVVYRVRFRVVNDGATDEQVTPKLLWSAVGDAPAWDAVPEVNPVPDVPFYAASDKGREYEVRTTDILPADLRATVGETPGNPVKGLISAGENPAPHLQLPADSYTDIEFRVRATDAAPWLAEFNLRLGLGEAAVTDRIDAQLTMEPQPEQVITPGQRSAEEVEGAPSEEPAFPLAKPEQLMATRHAAAAEQLTPLDLGPLAGSFSSPHLAEASLESDACASCHRTHTAEGAMLQKATFSPISTMCFSCHDGSGADANTKAEFTNPAFPANDPATSSFFRHPATVASDHVSDRTNEFEGVENRHSECSDCHQPHLADSTLPVMGPAGPDGKATAWSASGALKGASGVSVVNGAANTAPAYTWNLTSAKEYELCFKCHSAFTDLRAQDPAHPSRWALDKALEFNPSNASFHPVEAAGTNQTVKMNTNLAGTSPYKLWTFTTTSTIRCQNCHGSSTVAAVTADASIDNHASANRGILLRKYEDRVLSASGTLYAVGNFAECYLCHTEPPMTDTSRTNRADSNFRYHGLHMSGIRGSGSGGRDIDVAGAGQGNALCAECHFRIHGSSLAIGGQADNPRLVNFAPNVVDSPGLGFQFIVKTPTALGTCTMMCHGKDHQAFRY